MRRLAGAIVGLALGHAAVASAAQTLDAGVPTAGPVLVAGGVAWADATAPTPTLRVSLAGGPARALVAVAPAPGSSLASLSGAGDEITYTVSAYGTAPSTGGGPGLVASTAFSVAPAGGTPVQLLRCDDGNGTPGAAPGDGFTILRGCRAEPTTAGTPATPDVTIDGAVVGSGTAVAAAGAFAAWRAGPTVTVARATPALSVLGTVPAAGAWALTPQGDVVTAAAGVSSAQLAATAPGGPPVAIGEEPGGVFGLTAGAGGVIAFATQGADGSQTIVVRRGAQRLEVARFWPDPRVPGAVATDGTRVAWFSARCGGSDLTVATIGEPPIDQRATPCPVTIGARGGLARTTLSTALACDLRVAPEPCAARVRVRAGGRLIASGTVARSDRAGAPVALTSAGRTLVRGRRRLRAQVEAVREPAGGAPVTTRRAVVFVRGQPAAAAQRVRRSIASSSTASRLQKAKRNSGRASPIGSATKADTGIATTPASRGRRSASSRGVGVAQRRRVGAHEVGPLAGQHGESGGAQPGDQPVVLGAQRVGEGARQQVAGVQRGGRRVLQRRAAGKGQELLDPAHGAHQLGRTAGPADLPAGEGVRLAHRGDRQRALRHARERGQRDVLALQHQVLVDLVGDGDQVVLDAQARRSPPARRRRARDRSGCAGVLSSSSRVRGVIAARARRGPAASAADAAPPAHRRAGHARDRLVAVVDRLQRDHLVAGRRSPSSAQVSASVAPKVTCTSSTSSP